MNKKKPISPAPTQTVWITESFVHTDFPSIHRYEAVAVRPNHGGATVLMRGHKRVIPKASFRKFFTSEESLKDYMRRYLEDRKKFHQRSIDRVQKALDGEELPVDVIPCHPMTPEEHDRLKRAIQASFPEGHPYGQDQNPKPTG